MKYFLLPTFVLFLSLGALAQPKGPPPEEAVCACDNKKDGDTCSFQGPPGTITGSCRVPPQESTLACTPDRQGPPPNR